MAKLIYCLRIQSEKANILQQLEAYQGRISNFENYIANALALSSKLPAIWASSNISTKEKLQKLIFPDGICFNKENGAFRTENVNAVFACIASLASITGGNKKGTKHPSDDLSPRAES